MSQLKINRPTLLLDKNKCLANLNFMVQKAKKYNLNFRPHFKTHQSLEIGRWYKQFGINKITVSSLQMAVYFSEDWSDITVAFPVNILEIDTINFLASRIKLNILVESAESILFLKEHLIYPVNFFMKIDSGYHRCGILHNDFDAMDNIFEAADKSEKLTFSGFLAHAGHSYKTGSYEEVIKINKDSNTKMKSLKEKYSAVFPNLILSVGDTPSMSLAENFEGIDEIRPGNFIFYDLFQHQLGSNSMDKIAVAMCCPVVAVHKNAGEIIIYGGSVHFSKDFLIEKNGRMIFGKAVQHNHDGSWSSIIEDVYIKSLSQEHGVISAPTDFIEKIKAGDLLTFLPVHSCLTVSSMKSYQVIGTNEIIKTL